MLADERIASIHKLAEEMKALVREVNQGQCRIFSLGDACRCGLCLMDEIYALLDGREG